MNTDAPTADGNRARRGRTGGPEAAGSKPMRRPVLATALLTVGLIASPGAVYAQTPCPERLDTELLEARLDDFAEIADHTVLLEVRNGDDTWSEAIGPRSLEEEAREARPDDRVRVGSLTKSMTAVMILQLQREGEIDLDDRIGEHLPGLLPYEEDPTIRQVLNHTGGLPDFLPHLYPSLAEGDLSDVREGHRTRYEPEELIAIGTQGPLLFEPGTGWSYSNVGYFVLGLLVEEVTGNSFGHELEARILGPAGLERSYFPRGGSGIRGPHPVPYVTTGESDEPYFDTTKLSSTQLWAAGGVVSTTADLNDFYGALTDGTLLTESELAEATDYVATGGSSQYGLGLFGRRFDCPHEPEQVFFGHDGDALGHETWSFHSMDGERRITVAWNIGDKHGYADPEAFDAALEALLAAGLCGAPRE